MSILADQRAMFPAFVEPYGIVVRDFGHRNCVWCNQAKNLENWIMARRIFTPDILAIYVESANDPRCKIYKR